MALKFVCNTCEKEYEAQLSGRNLIYMDANKRIDLTDEDQDCSSCQEEINKEVEQAKANARLKVKERKNG